MAEVDMLSSSVQHTHELLSTRFEQASAMMRTPGQPRKCFEQIDTFLAIASKHLSGVDAALLPVVRKQVPDGSHVVHDYLRAARERARAGPREGPGVRLGVPGRPSVAVGGRTSARRWRPTGAASSSSSASWPSAWTPRRWTSSPSGSTTRRPRPRAVRTPTPRTPACPAWSRGG